MIEFYKQPLVSIIVPVYNVEKYLDECVCSLINQTYKNLEIILVDDGSPDNCPQMCDAWAGKDERVKVVHKKNGGLSSARNAALDILTGEYCMCVDSDDFIHPNTVKICMDYIYKYNLDIAEYRFRKTPNREMPVISSANFDIKLFDNYTIFTTASEHVTLCGKMMKTSLWNGVRMPVGRINEDDATTWKLYYRARYIGQINAILYLYYDNPFGICGTQKRTPNIENPLFAYHERIDYFMKKKEKELMGVSQWRLLKFIVLSFNNPSLTSEQKKVLNQEYQKNYMDVLKLKYVPFKQKVLFVIFRWNTKISRFAYKRNYN